MSTQADTQWPRWAVFKQDNPRKGHQMIGSVHAADPETALLQARTVFVRRPKAVSLWVAPMSHVHTLTLEEIDAGGLSSVLSRSSTSQIWQIFSKTSQRRGMAFTHHLGQVEAAGHLAAIDAGIKKFGDAESSGKTTWVWMAVPDGVIKRSSDDDIESWFLPAESKTYKQQSQYGFVSSQRQGRKNSS